MSDLLTCPTCQKEFDPIANRSTARGAVFQQTHPRRKYCSPECHASKARKRPPKKRPPKYGPQSNSTLSRLANAAAGRKQGVDPATCDRIYSEDEAEYLKAMERYRRENKRPFPTWAEALAVAIALGYRRVAPPAE
jgi:hypothetical protein